LFRGFLLDWLDGNCELLEGQLEKISSEQGLNTTILGFRQKGTENATGILVVSNFHPGPFLNVGSSVLPQMIQEALTGEKSVVAVPHGISGHEMNLVSQQENKKVIKDITRLASFSKYRSDATRILRVNSGNATASCQALGDCSLVTITLSPNDMEDIPLKIGV
jgi:predicted neutral ceramidase superfamily lipid hydrolase